MGCSNDCGCKTQVHEETDQGPNINYDLYTDKNFEDFEEYKSKKIF